MQFSGQQHVSWQAGLLVRCGTRPGEHVDLAAAYPDVVNQMVRTMEEMEKTVYLPDRGSDTGQACAKSKEYGGYFGPFLSDADFDIGAEDITVFNSE